MRLNPGCAPREGSSHGGLPFSQVQPPIKIAVPSLRIERLLYVKRYTIRDEYKVFSLPKAITI